VEIIRRVWEVFLDGASLGDFGALFDRGLYAPMSTVSPPAELLGAETYVGRSGFVEWLRLWTENFDEWRVSPEQIIDAGNDQVVVVAHQTARGSRSGAAVEEEFGIVYTLKNAQVTSQQFYVDPAEALKAVGLAEEAMSQESS
jgi:ketosteroid isomerase-like protein